MDAAESLSQSFFSTAGPQEGETDTGLEGMAQLLAQNGYVVLLPLMRGWGGGQESRLDRLASQAAWATYHLSNQVAGVPFTPEWGEGPKDCGPSQSPDTARMIEWLASQPGVDPDGIGVMGFSFGGQVALLTGALTDRVKAIVSYAGPTDWASLNARRPWYVEYSEPCQSDFKRHSPITVASRIKAPVLLIQGDADANVPPEQAEEMEQALWKSGGSVQLYLVRGAVHDETAFFSSWAVMQRFLEANLGKPSCVEKADATEASPQQRQQIEELKQLEQRPVHGRDVE